MAVAAGAIARSAATTEAANVAAANAAKSAAKQRASAAASKTTKTLTADDTFIADFVTKGTPVEAITQQPDKDIDQDLAESLSSTPGQSGAQKKAVDAGKIRDGQAEQDEQKRQEKLAQKGQDERSTTIQKGARKAGKIADPAIKRAGRFIDRVGAAQTAGGIGLLVVILIFLMFVVVKVNSAGDTRIKQFWYMLNGKARLEGRKNVNASDNGATGEFGDPSDDKSSTTTTTETPVTTTLQFDSWNSYRGFTGL